MRYSVVRTCFRTLTNECYRYDYSSMRLAMAAGTAAIACWGFPSFCEQDTSWEHSAQTTDLLTTFSDNIKTHKETTPTLLAISPPDESRKSASQPNSKNPDATFPVFAPAKENLKPMDYDFVIVGHGNAGRSALKILQRHCPSAKIAVVDPLRPAYSSNGADFFARSAVNFDFAAKNIELTNAQTLRYRHAILLATGSRGAPPPPTLLDGGALDRILELRPTQEMEQRKRPVLSPQVVRRLAFMASSQGATVAVLGSGWEAIELAVASAKAGNSSVLTFGSAGPLSHVLPRYLCTAVSRRLRKEGIQVQERSLVRYISNDDHSFKTPRLEIHTGKAYDLIDTQRTFADLLVVAPNVDGPRGTAVLPTSNTPAELDASFKSNDQPWYQALSQMTSDNMVVCYADDGRVVVNAELNAASHVYAAGSAAKYPNPLTGHAQVAGEGSVDGALAGQVAALHMSRDYHERTTPMRPPNDVVKTVSFATQSFPIWRSDMCSYLSEEEGETSALNSVGIRALCVGQCDSERMTTHGFWWTNQAVHRRLTRQASRTNNPRPRRRRTNGSKNLPVYGTGVVFYLDRRGKLCGIMTWGLPFTKRSTTKRSTDGSVVLNKDLVNRMKDVIRSNGGIVESVLDDLLKSSNLADESKRIAKMTLGQSIHLAKPLYRYTPSKPPSITSVGMIKRKDQTGSGELLGENLYVRKEVDVSDRPQSLVYMYPMEGGGHDRTGNETRTKAERLERAWHENELRARPPKEEPLWLRRGEAHRMINLRAAMAEIAEANMKAGKFSDGTDAVQQAKVPQVLQNAKRSVQGWIHSTESTDNFEESYDKSEEEESSNECQDRDDQ